VAIRKGGDKLVVANVEADKYPTMEFSTDPAQVTNGGGRAHSAGQCAAAIVSRSPPLPRLTVACVHAPGACRQSTPPSTRGPTTLCRLIRFVCALACWQENVLSYIGGLDTHSLRRRKTAGRV
jgi:hypothetical protein